MTKDCFLNPLNSNNKFGITEDIAEKIVCNTRPNGHKKRRNKKRGSRATVTRVITARAQKKTDQKMLVSESTFHMTPMEDRVGRKESCNHTINLADNSTVQTKEKGVRTVKWQDSDGLDDVHLTETLVAADLSMSLLSVPALVRKQIGVIFLSSKAVMVDL